MQYLPHRGTVVSLAASSPMSPHIDALSVDDLTEEERLHRLRRHPLPQQSQRSHQQDQPSPQQQQQTQQPSIVSATNAPARTNHEDANDDAQQPRNKRSFTQAQYCASISTASPCTPSVASPFVFQAALGPRAFIQTSQPSPVPMPVPNLTEVWGRAEKESPLTSSASSSGFKRNGTSQARVRHHATHVAISEEEQGSSCRKDLTPLARARQWVFMLPIRYGWPKLLLYLLFGCVFVFLAAHYVMHVIPAIPAGEVQGEDGHIAMELSALTPGEMDLASSVSQPNHEQVAEAVAAAFASPPVAPVVAVGELAPVASAVIVSSEEPAMHSLVDLQTPVITPLPTIDAATPIPLDITPPIVPVLPTAIATTTEVLPIVPAAVAIPAAPIPVDAPLPTPPAALPEVDLKKQWQEDRAAKLGSKAIVDEKEKASKKAQEKEKAKKEKEKEEKKKKEKKEKEDKKKKDDKKKGGKDKKKPPVFKRSDEELATLRVAAKAAIAPRPASTAVWTPPPATDGHLFGDDVVFILPTKSNRHEQVSHALRAWGSLAKNVLVFSNQADTQFGLGTIVLERPHSEWKPIDIRYHSWRVAQIMQYLHTRTRSHAKFYIWLDDVTFPLLDQIKAKLDAYRSKNGGAYPMYAGGPRGETNFFKSYWSEQQSKAYNLFKSAKLQSSPQWLFGFDSAFLDYIAEFIPVDVCPCLFGDDLAVAGMVACAGGVLPNDDRWAFDFFALQKKSPDSNGLLADSATAEAWRAADAYHGVDSKDMLDKSWAAYYEKAGVKAIANE